MLQALSVNDADLLPLLQRMIRTKLTSEYAGEVCDILISLLGEKKQSIKRALSAIKDFSRPLFQKTLALFKPTVDFSGG